MRFSEFSGKEIIGLDNGERMGVIGQSDLEINPVTGEINAIIVPGKSLFGWRKKREDVVIPWSSVLKIGADMIIVELARTFNGQAGTE